MTCNYPKVSYVLAHMTVEDCDMYLIKQWCATHVKELNTTYLPTVVSDEEEEEDDQPLYTPPPERVVHVAVPAVKFCPPRGVPHNDGKVSRKVAAKTRLPHGEHPAGPSRTSPRKPISSTKVLHNQKRPHSNDVQEDAGDNVEKEPKRQKTTQVKPRVRHWK